MRALFACVVSLPAAAQPLTRDGVWTPLPDLPIEVSNNAVTSVDHGDGTWTLYSFMGMRTPGTGRDSTVESFKLAWSDAAGALGPWTPIADAPRLNNRAKVAASAVTVAGEVYLIGGYTTLGRFEVTEDRLFRYDPALDVYTELAPVPTEVDDTVPAVVGDRYIYLVSGWHGPINDNTTAVQVYDTQTDSWTQATPIPGPGDGLFGHAGGVIETDSGATLVYMDGALSDAGFFQADRVYTGAISPADPAAIAWTEIPAHPGRPTYRAAGSLGTTPNGWLLIAGGTDNPYNLNGVGYNNVPSEPLEQALAFHAASGTWRELGLTGKPGTMDHRNLAPLGDGWALVGGMTAPRQMTTGSWLLTLDACVADLDGDRDIDSDDFDLFVARYFDRDPSADQNGDGSVTPADFNAWVYRAGRGCL